MFVDELKIKARAGKGGDGVVRWRHIRGKEFGGPSGGNGGRGGDVYALAVRDLNILYRYRNKKEFMAQDGGDGQKDSLEGANGIEEIINVPIGTVITNTESSVRYELLEEGERVLLLKGGKGGLGNEHFKNSRNTTPKEFTLGVEGEEGNFFIEVELVVDAGFVGFPNAGKSSLLNALTHAERKVADYPFTTLEPGLGELYGYIIADVPGLIEGAASGKGLGHKFLRHIKRTKVLLHCVPLDSENAIDSYNAIRKELTEYEESLAGKPELIVLTKKDLVDEEEKKSALKKMSKINKNVLAVSLYDDSSIKELSDTIIKFLKEQEEKDVADKST